MLSWVLKFTSQQLFLFLVLMVSRTIRFHLFFFMSKWQTTAVEDKYFYNSTGRTRQFAADNFLSEGKRAESQWV